MLAPNTPTAHNETTMTEDQFKQLLEQNNKQLIEQFDARLEARLNERLEQNNAVLFGQITRYFDSRFDSLHNELTTRTDRLYTTFDSLAKRLDADDKERAAINAEQARQNGWIGQLAKATNTKLVPEQ